MTFTARVYNIDSYDMLTDIPLTDPWTRTKRSFKKSKAKWRRRITRGERQQIENTHWNDPQVVA